MNTCDIIIPTYNGEEKLRHTIPALLKQLIPPGWSVRVIVSDDGSAGSIADFFTKYAWVQPWLSPILLRSSHKGRSHARNVALDAATADIVLFLADDMVLRPSALREHLLFHETHADEKYAALGCVMWDPRVRPTPLMEWMTHGGQQNDYDSILGAVSCSAAHYFYGSFVSVKRSFLGEDRFLDTFSSYGWEDLELGARLQTKGIHLHVLHHALALHYHHYTAGAILERQRTVGRAKYLVNTNSIRRMYHGIYGLFGARWATRIFLKKWGDRVNIPRFFAKATAGEFWYGVHHSSALLKSEKE